MLKLEKKKKRICPPKKGRWEKKGGGRHPGKGPNKRNILKESGEK